MAAVPDAPASGLIDVSEDQAERLVAQAARFGGVELSRAADLAASGLIEMRGATAPRLLLELVCARILLPGADHSTDGLLARLDRLERRVEITGVPTTPAAPAPPAAAGGAVDDAAAAYRPLRSSLAPGGPAPTTAAAAPPPSPAGRRSRPRRAVPPPRRPLPQPPTPEPAAAAPAPAAGLSLVDVRRLWPDIVEATKMRRRLAWMHLTQNSQVVSVEGNVLTLGFSNAGARDSFLSGGCDEILRQAAIDVVGADWRIETLVDPGAQPTPLARGDRPGHGGARAGGASRRAGAAAGRGGGGPGGGGLARGRPSSRPGRPVALRRPRRPSPRRTGIPTTRTPTPRALTPPSCCGGRWAPR